MLNKIRILTIVRDQYKNTSDEIIIITIIIIIINNNNGI